MMIENMLDTAELTAEWKSGDYEYNKIVIPPNQSYWQFPKERERTDMPDYTLVDKGVELWRSALNWCRLSQTLITGPPFILAQAQRTDRWQRKSSANFTLTKSAPPEMVSESTAKAISAPSQGRSLSPTCSPPSARSALTRVDQSMLHCIVRLRFSRGCRY
jgi:hypothetical protein